MTTTAQVLDIVLVEDDDIWAQVVRLFLEQPGFGKYRLRSVQTLAELQHVCSHDPVDVILSDLSLPDSSGIEVVERARHFAPDVPIIVLTSSNDRELPEQALLIGAQDYLVKGHFDHDDLHRSIRYASARSRSECRLRETMRQLTESNRQLEEYATIASHDLRSPVRTARVLFSKIRADRASTDASENRLADMLESNLGRLDAMLQGLLVYAQALDHCTSGEERTERFSDLLDRVLADHDADLVQVHATVKRLGDSDVYGHPLLLRSLLSNLVTNAIKYRSESPLSIEVEVGPTYDDRVQIRVEDNGIGIEPPQRQRVFGMFERLNSTSAGIGLGLALCNRIVALHGGIISIEDVRQPGSSGVSINFTLPVTARSMSEPGSSRNPFRA